MGWLRDLIDVIGLDQAHVLALLLGLSISWALTQVLKTNLPKLHGGRATLFAAVAAFLPTYTLAPPPGFAWDWGAFWLACFAALISPVTYKLVIALAKRFFPEFAKTLSGDP